MFIPEWFGGMKDHPKIATVITNLGGFLAASVAVSLVWELTVKRDFLYEIFAVTKLSSDVQMSGLLGISSIFYPLDWKDFFKDAKEIKIFMTYGSTWRNSNASFLKAFAQTKGKIRIVLPNPNNVVLVDELAKRYNKTAAVLKSRIEEAITDFNSWLKGQPCDYELRLTDIAPMFCIYSFDELKIVTLFTQRIAQHDVPTLIVGRVGTVAEFFTGELTDVLTRSSPHP